MGGAVVGARVVAGALVGGGEAATPATGAEPAAGAATTAVTGRPGAGAGTAARTGAGDVPGRATTVGGEGASGTVAEPAGGTEVEVNAGTSVGTGTAIVRCTCRMTTTVEGAEDRAALDSSLVLPMRPSADGEDAAAKLAMNPRVAPPLRPTTTILLARAGWRR